MLFEKQDETFVANIGHENRWLYSSIFWQVESVKSLKKLRFEVCFKAGFQKKTFNKNIPIVQYPNEINSTNLTAERSLERSKLWRMQ